MGNDKFFENDEEITKMVCKPNADTVFIEKYILKKDCERLNEIMSIDENGKVKVNYQKWIEQA